MCRTRFTSEFSARAARALEPYAKMQGPRLLEDKSTGGVGDSTAELEELEQLEGAQAEIKLPTGTRRTTRKRKAAADPDPPDVVVVQNAGGGVVVQAATDGGEGASILQRLSNQSANLFVRVGFEAIAKEASMAATEKERQRAQQEMEKERQETKKEMEKIMQVKVYLLLPSYY